MRTRQLLAVAALLSILPLATLADDLAAGFRNPPAVARPHTWWHWMNGNITREGITADLEAMKEIGLGGAQIFNVSESIPEGPIKFMSPEFRALVKHAVTEAGRLGIELCLHNCAGWSSSGGPWITPEYAMQMVVISEARVSGGQRVSRELPQPETRKDYYRDIAVLAFPTPRDDKTRIKDIQPKAGYEYRYNQQPALDEYPPDAAIQRTAILDLTDKFKAPKLEWDAPAGDWTILRIGHTPTGKDNHPSPESGRGLECDKLSREAMDVHWANAIAPILADIGPLAGKVLNNALIDSYEVGHQNWTPRFREEFQQRRGYDVLPFLVTLTGRVVDSGPESERFLWDFRRTIADLFADNYFGYFAELCHKNGLLCSIEPYDGPFECLQVGGKADIPMGEFWIGGGGERSTCKLAASVAHTNGRTIVGAESFTTDPTNGRWQQHPYSFKAIGDLIFSLGVNRYIMHRYAHQPWLDKYPGMTMGQWGTHFERTETWWKQSAAWVQYASRCQFLLQQGRFVADVLYFAGEEAPNGAPFKPELKEKGYDYDACGVDVLRRASVSDGAIQLPNGQRYRALACPESPIMTDSVLHRIRELAAQGANVLCPAPAQSPTRSTIGNDPELRKRNQTEWAKLNTTEPGRGRVFSNQTIEQVLAAIGVQPDCEFRTHSGKPKVVWIHRATDDADIYFVANQKPRGETVECTFRVSGKAPELWHPDTGQIEPAPVWSARDGRTTVPIHFDPAGSVFVVFRKPADGAPHIASITPPTDPAPSAAAPRIEITKAVYEATDGAGGADVTAKVRELVDSGETAIAANNANFGDPSYNHVKRLRVEYSVNGEKRSGEAAENAMLELVPQDTGPAALPAFRLAAAADGRTELIALKPGAYELKQSDGGSRKLDVGAIPDPIEIRGPWSVSFPPNWGAPPQITLDKLISWPDHADPGVRYFSGTATYTREFEVPAALCNPATALYLDLGRVAQLAEVRLNDQDLGVWWKPPFAADVSRAIRPGGNRLTVRVTNLWVNRLIGDEQHPDDCEWNGKPLKRWPDWFLTNKPRPVPQRLTFSTWKHWTKDSPLIESGLLGPVRLVPAMRQTIEP